MTRGNGEFSHNDGISLKEFFEVKLSYIEKALILQATEYERRLETLNHEAARLTRMQETYLPRGVWDQWSKTVEEDIEELKLSRATIAGKASQSALIITTILSLAGLILGLLRYI